MALLYRWNADMNPLHADPAIAKAAGFPRPILHGLGTFGVAGHAILQDDVRLRSGAVQVDRVRFSAPVYPGETIRTEMWRDGSIVSFRARVVERDVVALNNGRAEIGQTMASDARHRGDRQHPRRGARAVRAAFPANTGASSIASAPIRPSSSMR